MAGHLILVSFSFFLAISSASSIQTLDGKIKISVGTTSSSTEVASFIRNQLIPTFEQYGNFLDIEIVPWGRTVRNPDGTTVCELGASECWANRMHRCVLNHLRGNTRAQLNYLICEFTSPFPAFQLRSYACATAAGMRIIEADFCVMSPNRDTLDQEAEAASGEAMTSINSVPYVVFNGNVNVEANALVQSRLLSEVCFALADDASTGVRSCQI